MSFLSVGLTASSGYRGTIRHKILPSRDHATIRQR